MWLHQYVESPKCDHLDVCTSRPICFMHLFHWMLPPRPRPLLRLLLQNGLNIKAANGGRKTLSSNEILFLFAPSNKVFTAMFKRQKWEGGLPVSFALLSKSFGMVLISSSITRSETRLGENLQAFGKFWRSILHLAKRYRYLLWQIFYTYYWANNVHYCQLPNFEKYLNVLSFWLQRAEAVLGEY